MSPQVKPSTSIFLFREGPKFEAWDRGSLILRVDPQKSRSFRVGYHVLFVLYGLPAKIIYKGPSRDPRDVDHLEYWATNRDFVFLRNFKRLLSHLDSPRALEKLLSLVNSFYGEEKADKVKEYLSAWGFWAKALSHDNFSQNAEVVVV